MPDHVNRHRRQFERNGHNLQSQPLPHERTHVLRSEYSHQISAGHDRGYLEKLAHVDGLAQSELKKLSDRRGRVLDLASMMQRSTNSAFNRSSMVTSTWTKGDHV